MTKKYSAKRALVASLLVLAICFTSFLATTFAWFTDAVSSDNNIIQTGRLDVEMYWAEGKDDPATATWKDASGGAIFNNDKWEPGYTEVRHIKIANEGTLALQYKVVIVANGEVTDLADVIDVYYIDPAVQVATRDALATAPKLGTLTEVLAGLGESGSGYLAKGESDMITIALKMQESAGNEYQNTALCDGGFTIQLLATQAAGEYDSFGNDYDKIAAADFFPGFQGGSASIAVALDDQGLTAGKSVIDTGDSVAVIPTGVKLANGNQLELTVTVKSSTESNILLGENEKMRPVDVHIEGVAADNTTPMLIILENYMTTGINTGALKLYHVENGVTVPMTQVATPVNHNEFSYDPLTGDVTLALASFSEIATVANTTNPWNGAAATSFSAGDGSESNPYLITNADQLAYFRNLVDGGKHFDNEFVKLNNNIYLDNVNFDPIGWGYVNSGWNRNGDDGKVFQGTFDGNNKIIFDLYQNGWDLEDPDNDGVQDADYTYTNCGFGLFAAAANATFQNLTIYGAYVRAECVEMGVLVGLSQGSCTYNNIEIINSKIANYQRPTGGLIGEVSPLDGGTTTIKDVTIGADVVVGSLWGDFDAPCGGVIGARWDDTNTTKVYMENVKVHCRMDVYSDVTSAYQWYAYRRAGMLIGNTEMVDKDNKHLAAAPFLECKNVEVCYGDWANYRYCQFENQDNDWCNNYPWVRVEAGENCSAYSNPRYGQPVVDGVTVSTSDHICTNGNHETVINFSQLYGGGQGVYGQPLHTGVSVVDYRYSITYMNNNQVLAIKYVTENGAVSTANGAAEDLVRRWADENLDNYQLDGWMSTGSVKWETISKDNTEDVILYPYFLSPHTARFVDLNGNVLAWCFFNESDESTAEVVKAEMEASKNLPDIIGDLAFDYWMVKNGDKEEAYDSSNFTRYTTDVTIYPVYKYHGNIRLTPVDSDGDGETNYYQIDGLSLTVSEYNKLTAEEKKAYMTVNIPDEVNGIYVTHIAGDAFSDFADLEVIHIPNTVTYIGTNAFVKKGEDEQITIYYDGTKAEWDAIEKNFADDWDKYIGTGSKIYFTDNSSYEKKGINGIITYWR